MLMFNRLGLAEDRFRFQAVYRLQTGFGMHTSGAAILASGVPSASGAAILGALKT
jgi:hypothetical protein